MVARVVGNRGGQRQLQGKQAPMSNVNWVAVTGQAGDVAYIRCTSFNNHGTHLSYAVQGDAVGTVDFTLANEELACSVNPHDQAMVHWGNTITASGVIQPLVANGVAIRFTAARVTFTGTGVIYIFGR